MKTCLIALVITALTPFLCAASDTNGFLVFKIGRLAYSTTNGSAISPEIEQAFKIPLTPEFLSNFKHLPIPWKSQGTGFCCGGRIEKIPDGGFNVGFTWWLERTSDHRWHIHIWGSMNPTATQSVTIKNLEDLDMSYLASYVNMTNGVNESFDVKYMSADAIQHEGPIPTASVTRADRSELFKADRLTNCPEVLSGLFQEN